MEALIQKEACSLNRVSKESTQEPILGLGSGIFMLELRPGGWHKCSKLFLLSHLLSSYAFAADLENLGHVKLMLKAAKEIALQRS